MLEWGVMGWQGRERGTVAVPQNFETSTLVLSIRGKGPAEADDRRLLAEQTLHYTSDSRYQGYAVPIHFSAMASRRNRTILSLSVFIGVLAWNVAAAAVKGDAGVLADNMTPHAIEEQLQVRWSSNPDIL